MHAGTWLLKWQMIWQESLWRAYQHVRAALQGVRRPRVREHANASKAGLTELWKRACTTIGCW